MKRMDTKTVEELLGDTEEVSTDLLVGLAHENRADTEYQDDSTLLENLPVVLRGVCDYVLSGEAKRICGHSPYNDPFCWLYWSPL